LWPIVAVGMFLIAGGALVLVWQTMQQQQPPASVVITSEQRHDPPPPPPPPVADAGVVMEAPAVDAAIVQVNRPPPPPPPPRGSPYDRDVESLVPRMNTCVHEHPDPTVPTAALIHIGTDGRPKTVSLQPDALNATALGSCIRGVLQTGRFPKAADETDLKFPFHPKSG
jgi:hypothetical protein